MFDIDTTFRHAKFRSIRAFRVAGNLGAVLMWKPTMFVIGVELWQHGGGLYLGPFAVGFGPVDPLATGQEGR